MRGDRGDRSHDHPGGPGGGGREHGDGPDIQLKDLQWRDVHYFSGSSVQWEAIVNDAHHFIAIDRFLINKGWENTGDGYVIHPYAGSSLHIQLRRVPSSGRFPVPASFQDRPVVEAARKVMNFYQ